MNDAVMLSRLADIDMIALDAAVASGLPLQSPTNGMGKKPALAHLSTRTSIDEEAEKVK